jgi:putative membrane protein
LLPIALGGICGVVLFGNIIKYLLESYLNLTSFLFIGLILGSIPALFKQVNTKKKFKLHYVLFLLIAFAIGISMVYLENYMVVNNLDETNLLYLFFAGTSMSVGVIVPGVSSTLILMLLGVYNIYISAVSTLYMPVLIFIGMGLIVGSIIAMKITKFLLDKFYAETFYAIIGFTLGSIFVLYPGFSFDLTGLASILCLLSGILIARLI